MLPPILPMHSYTIRNFPSSFKTFDIFGAGDTKTCFHCHPECTRFFLLVCTRPRQHLKSSSSFPAPLPTPLTPQQRTRHSRHTASAHCESSCCETRRDETRVSRVLRCVLPHSQSRVFLTDQAPWLACGLAPWRSP